ncbi:hypothetical protein ADL26_11320, partial [Thermoactinomyces vulgaris]
ETARGGAEQAHTTQTHCTWRAFPCSKRRDTDRSVVRFAEFLHIFRDERAEVRVKVDTDRRPLHLIGHIHGGSATDERIEDSASLGAPGRDAPLHERPGIWRVVRASGKGLAVRFDEPDVLFLVEAITLEEVAGRLGEQEDVLVLPPGAVLAR